MGRWLLIVILLTGFLSSTVFSKQILAAEQQSIVLEHERYPSGENVCAWRSVVVTAVVLREVGNGCYSMVEDANVTLCIRVQIHAKTNVREIVKEGSYSIPMICLEGVYFGVIPGLPARTVPTVAGEAKIWSEVHYSFTVSIRHDFHGNFPGGYYRVVECAKGDTEPPLTCIVAVNESNAMGLTTRGWVWPQHKGLDVVVLALDDVDVKDVHAFYSVNDGDPRPIELTEDKILLNYREILHEISDLIEALRETLRLSEDELPSPTIGISVKRGAIPGQPAGCYVKFFSEAIDTNGNIFRSPLGLYYVTNKYSHTRILVLDPHVLWWIVAQSREQLRSLLRYLPELPENYREQAIIEVEILVNVTKHLKEANIEFFHHWEWLCERYNVYIASHVDEMSLLLLEGSFTPDVIWLSNLYLGVESLTVVDYDMRDYDYTVNQECKNALLQLIEYVKRSHAGLIVTQGALTDWVIALSEEETLKIGCRGHIGYSFEDVNIVNETTLAALLGMPQLTLWECVKDALADMLCSNPATATIGMLLKLMPLQLSHVPLNSSMVKTMYGTESEILQNVPEKFEICIPDLKQSKRYMAYTHVGWQFAFSRQIALTAFQRLKAFANEVNYMMEAIVEAIEEILRDVSAGPSVHDTIDWGLEELYMGIVNASIHGHSLNASFKLKGLNRPVSLNISIDFTKLFNYIPAKLIAVSEDKLAAIITYDKYWVDDGYRSVYFSFEIEACSEGYCKSIVLNAIEWTLKWRRIDITGKIGAVRALKSQLDRFKSINGSLLGDIVFDGDLITTEETFSQVEFSVPEDGRSILLIILHPTMDEITVKVDEGNIVGGCTQERVSTFVITNVSGEVKAYIRADADLSLNPVHVTTKCTNATVLPEIVVTAPENNSIVHGGKVTVKWSIVDGAYKVEKVEICIDNGTWIDVTGLNSYTFENLAEGTHVISIRVTDSMGFTGQVNIVVKVTIEKKGGIAQEMPLGIIGVVLGAIAIIMGAVLLLKRRRR